MFIAPQKLSHLIYASRLMVSRAPHNFPFASLPKLKSATNCETRSSKMVKEHLISGEILRWIPTSLHRYIIEHVSKTYAASNMYVMEHLCSCQHLIFLVTASKTLFWKGQRKASTITIIIALILITFSSFFSKSLRFGKLGRPRWETEEGRCNLNPSWLYRKLVSSLLPFLISNRNDTIKRHHI